MGALVLPVIQSNRKSVLPGVKALADTGLVSGEREETTKQLLNAIKKRESDCVLLRRCDRGDE